MEIEMYGLISRDTKSL